MDPRTTGFVVVVVVVVGVGGGVDGCVLVEVVAVRSSNLMYQIAQVSKRPERSNNVNHRSGAFSLMLS